MSMVTTKRKGSELPQVKGVKHQKLQPVYVIKRDGRRELSDPKKIMKRLKSLKETVEKYTGTELHVNILKITKNTSVMVHDGITTYALDNFAAHTSAYILDHPDYQAFAGNIVASNLMSDNTDVLGFKDYVERAHNYVDEVTQKPSPLINDRLYRLGKKFGHIIDNVMDMNRNYLIDFFGMQTLLKGKYLLGDYKLVTVDGVARREMVPFETPQHMFMRVALENNGQDLLAAFEVYDCMSRKYATHATPTLFNAGTRRPQMSSCFLLSMQEDSISGIFDTLKQCALISKEAGGIGLSVNNIRSSGSYIASTRGNSNGLVPMLRVFNNTAHYVDQGGGKRKGSFAMYVSPYHADLLDFLQLKNNVGIEELRARDLFYALWVSDLFMERVIQEFSRRSDEPAVIWSFFDPNTVSGLDEVYGDVFKAKYLDAEAKGQFVLADAYSRGVV